VLVGGDVAGRVCLTAGIALFIDEDDCAYGSYEAGWWALGMRKWGFGFRWSGLFVDLCQLVDDMRQREMVRRTSQLEYFSWISLQIASMSASEVVIVVCEGGS
jgi:hypothetical protein